MPKTKYKGHETANQRYERKLKEQGLNKVTVWVPVASEDYFKALAEFCKENPDCYPSNVKSFKTGRMVKHDLF